MQLLDTSALIELEHEFDRDVVGPLRQYVGATRGQVFACSTIAIGELAAGDEDLRVRYLLRTFRKLAVSEAVAYRAAALERELSRRGRRLGENDNWIAATALHYSATLVYCDGDFDRVPNLKRRFIDVKA